MAPQVLEHPGTRPTERTHSVDIKRIHPAGDPFTSAPRHEDLRGPDHDRDEPHGCFACYQGTVFLSYEEDGHEWTEPVPCRRCDSR